ncbi:MAG: thioredoxin domain-containing protein [Bacteroidota bacterium]
MSAHLKPPVNEKDHAEGTDTASIVLVEYGDYQCPHCGAAYPVIKKIQKTFGSQVRFVFRNFPLSEIHPDAMAAAIATEAAALQDKFWQMHDIIFENQELLGEEGLHKMAGSIGLDMKKFQKDMQREDLQAKVEADFESGVRSGVNGTPSFFIDGNKFDGGANDLFNMLRENAS